MAITQSDIAYAPGATVAPVLPIKRVIARAVGLIALALLELALLSFFYDPAYQNETPSRLVAFFREAGTPLINGLILTAATFLIITWSERITLLRGWAASISGRAFAPWLALNVAVLGLVLAFSVVISADAETYTQLIVPYLLALAVLGTTFLLAIAPFGFWRDLISSTWISIVLSICVAAIAVVMSGVAQAGWKPLAGATLHVSHWILSLYETNIVVDIAKKELGVGDFVVNIAPNCSGYEGIALVTAFMSLYLVVFRRDLAFPNALFLLPAGIVTIWLLNAVRIAALVSIGSHASPDVAVGGFHSQAGWIAFLLVTVGLMALSHTLPFFRKHANAAISAPATSTQAEPRTEDQSDDALAWLAPFIALMAASIVAAAFVPHDKWLYGLRVAGIGAAIWAFRSFYWSHLKDRVDVTALIAGVAVGGAWIATDPAAASGANLSDWLATLSPAAAAVWLALRAAGTIVFVPIAEEFAFRGYLHRLITSARVAALSPVMMTLIACVITSVLFGAIHQRWLAGCLAGVAFALVMYRSGRISSAVVAHMAANAAIFAWAVALGQWSLL